MSLIGFHKFLISTAILFSLGFSIRQWSEFDATGDRWMLIMAIVSGIAAVTLGYYLKHLRDFLRIPSEDLATALFKSVTLPKKDHGQDKQNPKT